MTRDEVHLHVDTQPKTLKSNLSANTRVTASMNYDDVTNKPSINGVELSGNKSFEDLGANPMSFSQVDQIVQKNFKTVFGGK